MVLTRYGVDAFLTHNGRVLLGKRKADAKAFPGQWELPGGGIEGSETPQQALEREMQEELGVRVFVKEQVHSYEDVHNGVRYVWSVFHAQLRDEPQYIHMKEHDALRWISTREDLALLPMTDEMRKVITSCLSTLHR